MITKIVDTRQNMAIIDTKATNQKGATMADEKRGHSRSPDLKQLYIRVDEPFRRRLKAASALTGQDQADFLRESAETRICAVFAANGGNSNNETDTEA